MKPKFRILKRGNKYYVQYKVLFMWFYEKMFAPGAGVFSDYMVRVFDSYEEARNHIEYELEKWRIKPKKEPVEIIEYIEG